MRGTRLASAVLLTLGFLLSSVGVAGAHYVYDRGYVWEDGDRCASVRSEVSHGGGNGYIRGEVWMTQRIGYIACEADYNRSPNLLIVDTAAHFWNGSQWVFCQRFGWKRNSVSTDYLSIAHGYTSLPCGQRGYYSSISGGFHYLDGQWRGGHRSSGSSHYLPA